MKLERATARPPGVPQAERQRWRDISGLALPVLALSLGCGAPPPPPPAPVPELATIDSSRVQTTIFLIGDAGAPQSPKDRVLVELGRQGKEAKRGSSIVFLGDNVYPRGIPAPEDSSAHKEASRRLLVQAALADTTGLRVIFVPGNHDWAKGGEDGWASVQRADLMLQEYSKERRVKVEQLPSLGCPGPAVTMLSRGIRLIAIDTHWWLQTGSRAGRFDDSTWQALPRPDVRCPATTEAAIVDSLRATFATGDYLDILAGHHPLTTKSEHGGHFPLLQYLFPAIPTPVAKWAWLPLGWIYPFVRRFVVQHPQDTYGSGNRGMRQAIEGTFRDDRPFIYAAGHDHTLQVLRGGPNRYYLVSGSGIENHQSWVRKRGAMHASSRPGFMRVDVFNRDSVRLGVTVITKQNTAVESYRVWLKR